MDNKDTQDGQNLIALVRQRQTKRNSIAENQQMKAAPVKNMEPPHPSPPPTAATMTAVPEFKMKPREDDYVRHTFYAEARDIKEVKYWALIDDRGQSEILREAMSEWLAKRQADR